MDRPPITDAPGVVDATRRLGSVAYLVSDVPGEFTAWRRRIRRAALMAECRIGVHRIGALVLVYNPDYATTLEQTGTAIHAVASSVLGREPDVSYDEELHRRRRARLHVVRDENP